MEYYIISIGIPGLGAFLTWIGQDLRKIGDSPQDIVSFFIFLRKSGLME